MSNLPGTSPENIGRSRKFTRRDFLILAGFAGTAAVLGPLLTACQKYLPRATATAPVPVTPDLKTLEFLNSVVVALQNAETLENASGRIFDAEEIAETILYQPAIDDPVTIGQLLPPVLDHTLLKAIDQKLQKEPVLTLADAKAKSNIALVETLQGTGTIQSLTSMAEYYEPPSIINRWQNINPKTFTEPAPPAEVSPALESAITRAQSALPIPESFHTDDDQSYFDAEGITISESQIDELIKDAQAYLREKGATVAEIELVESRMYAIAVWHEVAHGLDINANPNLLLFLPKDDKLKAVCLTRLKAPQLDQIASHIPENLSLTGEDIFRTRSTWLALVGETADDAAFYATFWVYGADALARILGKYPDRASQDAISQFYNFLSGQKLSDYLASSLNGQIFTRTELADGNWVNKIATPENAVALELFNSALTESVASGQFDSEIQTRIDYFNDRELSLNELWKELPELVGSGSLTVDEDHIPATLVAQIVVDQAAKLIFSGKYSREIDQGVMRRMFLTARYAVSEQLAEVCSVYLLSKDDPEKVAIIEHLVQTPEVAYLKEITALLGSAEVGKIFERSVARIRRKYPTLSRANENLVSLNSLRKKMSL
ncbi:MAG: hypothetical protein AAB874_07690 [Patescibacteria group bacterium]